MYLVASTSQQFSTIGRHYLYIMTEPLGKEVLHRWEADATVQDMFVGKVGPPKSKARAFRYVSLRRSPL